MHTLMVNNSLDLNENLPTTIEIYLQISHYTEGFSK